MAKTIGISEGVYNKLLQAKHEFEEIEKRVISFDDIIEKLIQKNNGGEQ